MTTRDYQNSKVYCINNDVDDEVYVGSTTQPLSKRMVKHRCDVKTRPNKMKVTQHMASLGIENFYIELLEECPCDNIDQLMKKEGEWIRKIGTLNDKIQGRSHWETTKKWREENREKYLQSRREYRQKNIEQVREKDNARYHANKKEIYEKAKEWKSTRHVCECGGTYTNSGKSVHMKCKKHQIYLQQHDSIKK